MKDLTKKQEAMLNRQPRRDSRKCQVHKYRLITICDKPVYKCWNCVHFMPSHFTEILVGRESICWRCGQEFQLTERIIADLVKQPHCEECTRRNLNPAERTATDKAVEALMEQMGLENEELL